jgi:hypothetical protein
MTNEGVLCRVGERSCKEACINHNVYTTLLATVAAVKLYFSYNHGNVGRLLSNLDHEAL